MKTSTLKKGTAIVFLLFFGLAGLFPAYGQEGKYTLYELGTLGGSRSKAYDINDTGQIVGESETTLYRDGVVWQAFTGTKDGISPLFPGEEGGSSANAINQDGTIAGFKNGTAFLVGGGSPFSKLGVLPGAGQSSGLGINSGRKVVGYSWNEGVWGKGALWEKDDLDNYLGSDLGSFGGLYTRATSVNDSDFVVGYSQDSEGSNRAFRWKKIIGGEPLTDLGVLDGFTESFALRLNNRGTAVGYSLRYDEFWNETIRACLWGENDIQELGKNALRISETVLQSQAYGINDAGLVVGTHWVEIQGEAGVKTERRAFLWDAVNEMRDLNSLLPENPGLLLVAAYAINNKGEIVGYGYKEGSNAATAFLLVPPANEDPFKKPFAVDIDIRPWNPNNKINLQARWGLIPIAILSEEDFDAPAEVDRQSLTFGRSGDEKSLAFCMSWKWDVNHDRKEDLICYFRERATDFQCGDTVGILQGKTVAEKTFTAQDEVQIVPCPPGRRHHRGR